MWYPDDVAVIQHHGESESQGWGEEIDLDNQASAPKTLQQNSMEASKEDSSLLRKEVRELKMVRLQTPVGLSCFSYSKFLALFIAQVVALSDKAAFDVSGPGCPFDAKPSTGRA